MTAGVRSRPDASPSEALKLQGNMQSTSPLCRASKAAPDVG